MKLSVSNIAWDPPELAEHLALLRDLGCHGVELAPSILWPEPVDASEEERRRVAALIRRHDLEVAGFHALLYSRPDLQLFKDQDSRRQTVEYLGRLARLCGDLGGRVMVFGSPRNRARNGRDYAESLAWAAEGFRAAAEEATRAGILLCIEPLAPGETDFIRSNDEGMELVRLVNHPHFRLHLDAKAMIESGEDYETSCAKYGAGAAHMHVGDPGLAPPGSTGVDHAPIGRAVRRSGYQGYVSIEMHRGFGPSREVIARSVAYVRRCYVGDA